MEVEYLVRGALLYCDNGSHPRRLNLPKGHGVYALGKPLIRETDCLAQTNISYFGVCNSTTPPAGAPEILLAGYVAEGENPNAVADVCGFKCMPALIGTWRGINKNANITGEFSAVTTNSYLVCACGGLIQAATSGQEYDD